VSLYKVVSRRRRRRRRRRGPHSRLHSNYFLSLCAARELIKFVNCKMHLATRVFPCRRSSSAARPPRRPSSPFRCAPTLRGGLTKAARKAGWQHLSRQHALRKNAKETRCLSLSLVSRVTSAPMPKAPRAIVAISEASLGSEASNYTYRRYVARYTRHCPLVSQLTLSSISDADTATEISIPALPPTRAYARVHARWRAEVTRGNKVRGGESNRRARARVKGSN